MVFFTAPFPLSSVAWASIMTGLICLNVPVVTNPPYSVRGVMVPGFSSPPKSFNTYPPDLSDELKDAVNYEVDIPLWGPDLIGLSEAEFVRYSVRIGRLRTSLRRGKPEAEDKPIRSSSLKHEVP